MNKLTIITAAVAIAAAFAAPAQAASADDAMTGVATHYAGLQERGEWRNTLMPQGTGMVAWGGSGDARLAAIVAAYDRATLDRGGWSNAVFSADHYASGEPLLAVKVGDGVTTRTAAAETAAIPRNLASR